MPKKRQSKPLDLHYPAAYIVSLLANRLALQHEDGFILADFGLVDRSGLLMDHFACILSEFTLQALKENLVQYSDKIGLPKNPVPSWTPPNRKETALLPVVDFVHVTCWEDKYAEICFMNFSQAQASDRVQLGEGYINAWGVAMVRCSLDLQRHFLHSQYDNASL